MEHFKEICPNVFQWSKFSEEKKLDFNGTVLLMGRRSILIDPVPMSVDQIQEIQDLAAPEAILLTNKDHTRDSHGEADMSPIPERRFTHTGSWRDDGSVCGTPTTTVLSSFTD